MSSEQLRVLIVAEHASAKFGGEAFLPLHYFRVLRERNIEAWLVCHGRVEAEVRETFPADQERLYFIPDLFLHRVLESVSAPLPPRVAGVSSGALSHLLTQLLQRRLVREIVRAKGVNVVHEPIPVSPKLPSAMFDVGAPVVIGPMNGGMSYPAGFAHLESATQRLGLGAARYAANLFNRVIPGKRRAALLLVANARTRAALPKVVQRVPVVELVENGVDLKRFKTQDRSVPVLHPKVRFAFVGRLVDWKAVDLLLEAVAQARRSCEITLDIFGDGEERGALEALSARLELGDVVNFRGFLPQARVASELGDNDVLVLPSLAECGGAVVLEAMALGLPVIATNWGGPADYLDATCGILIEPTNRRDFVADLSRAIRELASSPAKRRALGAAGRDKVVALYDWERKVDRMLALYARVAARRAPSDSIPAALRTA